MQHYVLVIEKMQNFDLRRLPGKCFRQTVSEGFIVGFAVI